MAASESRAPVVELEDDRSLRRVDGTVRLGGPAGAISRRQAGFVGVPDRRASRVARADPRGGDGHNVAATGKGISQQTYGLPWKFPQVDGWVATTDLDVIEVHPELSFATLAGHPLAHPKSTWAGFAERRRILADCGIEMPHDVDGAGENAAVDDVLDAAAALWTGLRFADGRAVSYPSVPERFADGTTAAIWA